MTRSITVVFITILACAVVGAGLYFFILKPERESDNRVQNPNASMPNATSTPAAEVDDTKTVIGQSTGGENITAYHYGEGDTELLFVGGVHGGYAWNTTLVAYQLMDYLEANPNTIPANVRVTVIPVLNPDGLKNVVGSSTSRFKASDIPNNQTTVVSGRFNANKVDLNRNFDCDWNKTATWQKQSVNPGTGPFSEAETQAFRKYVEEANPTAVLAWYSAAGGVFASSCHNGVLPDTKTLTDLYATASGYRAYQEFNFYEITGDLVNWLAKENIPAISVLLTNHEETEWDKNQKGIDAILKHYAR